WAQVHVNAETGPLRADTSAVFRTHFNLTAENVVAGGMLLEFGMIDDDGWVYLNGRLAGESHEWDASPAFEVGRFLHEGDNVVAVVVHNGDGDGGINKGVSLTIRSKTAPAPQWKRSVFGGLAQVIVQAGREPGELRLAAHADGLA